MCKDLRRSPPPKVLKELNEGQRSSSKTRSGLPTSSDPRAVEAAK